MSKGGFPVSWKKTEFFKYFFTSNFKIFSDKIAEFIIDCNIKTSGDVVCRISRIFQHIFIDEVQDLAGWELELIKLFFASNSNVLLVGDPRQVTYLTHHSNKYKKYRGGKVGEFMRNECKKIDYQIDYKTLKKSHRNNDIICSFSSKLFPEYQATEPCECVSCRTYKIDHEGVFLVRPNDVSKYIDMYNPTILKWSGSIFPNWNFGKSKGLSFNRVLIYPTVSKNGMCDWLKNINTDLSLEARCKFYVALTRARYSVGIVYDFTDEENIPGTVNFM